MSADENPPGAKVGHASRPPAGAPAPRRGSTGARAARIVAWVAGGIGALLILLIAAIAWYSSTADFQRRVANEIVSVLEDSTGGRVEIGGVHFSLWHLSVEVDRLVIHGLEGPGEAPYRTGFWFMCASPAFWSAQRAAALLRISR